jgi:hypothetical protein
MIDFLTFNLANKIGSGEKFSLQEFFTNANNKHFFNFSHYNFFYSYPEWGKKWPNEKICQFHSVDIVCRCCRKKPNRNYAGVGSINLMKSILAKRDFILLCDNCVKMKDTQLFLIQFKQSNKINTQLTLF